MKECLPPPDVAAETMIDLDMWFAEGGAVDVQPPARLSTAASMQTTQRRLLERLGAALVREWHTVPMPLQRAIYDRAAGADSKPGASARRRRIARFLHDHMYRTHIGRLQRRTG